MGKTNKRQHVTKSGDTFEWEETDEVRAAVERLHQTIRELEKKAPDYGVGK
jgi:ubiquinone biosynthesis protein UbiJ|tara:strand:- start:439 stop:591 length:153 start_codon:yes stop_codon:yes gene_type:complete